MALFGQAFTGGFQQGIRSGQLSKQMAAQEQARQDQLGFQERQFQLQERQDARAAEAHSLALQQQRAALAAQEQTRQRQLQFQADAQAALATGDFNALLTQYPDQAPQLLALTQTQQAIQQLQGSGVDVRRVSGQAFNALARGDREGARTIIEGSRNIIEAAGDPSFTVDTALEMLDSDPGQLAEMMQGVYQMAGGSADRLVGVQGKITPFQQAQLDIEAEKNQIARDNLILKQKQNELAQATTDLQRQKLIKEIEAVDQRIAAGQQKQAEAQASQQATYDSMVSITELTQEILNDPNLNRMVGTIQPSFWTVSSGGQDLLNKFKRLQSLITADNLDLMTGVLSESDIKIIANVGAALNIQDPGLFTGGGILGSEQGVKDELERIYNTTKDALDKAAAEGKFQGLQGAPGGAASGTTSTGIPWSFEN